MNDQEKMELAKRQCQRIYPKIRKLETLLEKLRTRHKRWATIYEKIQLKHARIERITLKMESRRMSPTTFKKEIDALEPEQRELLMKALNGNLEI